MRTSVASLAIIKSCGKRPEKWLLRWNEKWGKYNLIGGHREHGETFRQCLIREINEEVGLVLPQDYTIGSDPVELTYRAWSDSAQQETDYHFQLFQVSLNESGYESLDRQPSLYWADVEEIDRQVTWGNEPISSTVKTMFDRLGLC